MNKIENANDIESLVNSESTVVLMTYRGEWCPFCNKYLSKFSESLKSIDNDKLIVGISSESVEKCEELKNKLNLEFELISDPNLTMHKLHQVNINTGNNNRGPYLQPSVFIFHKGVKVFEWIQHPSLFKNLGGAVNRIPVEDVIKELNSLPIANN